MTTIKWDQALDAVIAAPDHHKILLENDEVRVLETRVAPGDRTPVHTHRWAGVLYIVSWSDFRRYNSRGELVFDSRTNSLKPEPGASIWSGPIEPHFVENTGDQELRVIAVELKKENTAK